MRPLSYTGCRFPPEIIHAIWLCLRFTLSFRDVEELLAERGIDFLFRSWQGELEYSAARLIHACPQPAPVAIDDRPADRQPHPHPAGFRGVERLEHALEIFGVNTRPRIADCHQDSLCLALFRADRQLSW